MNWHKLSEEQPKEKGVYLICDKGGRYMFDTGTPQSRFRWQDANITHWLKVEPPQEAKEKGNG